MRSSYHNASLSSDEILCHVRCGHLLVHAAFELTQQYTPQLLVFWNLVRMVCSFTKSILFKKLPCQCSSACPSIFQCAACCSYLSAQHSIDTAAHIPASRQQIAAFPDKYNTFTHSQCLAEAAFSCMLIRCKPCPLNLQLLNMLLFFEISLAENGLTGTKLGCGEGGCGACTVMLSHWDAGKVHHRAVNACLCPLYAVEGAHVVTVEGTVKHTNSIGNMPA